MEEEWIVEKVELLEVPEYFEERKLRLVRGLHLTEHGLTVVCDFSEGDDEDD